MRVLHTSDWHLGHTLRGEVTREHEHAAFLAWLLAACADEVIDVLLITGDVFDSATPPASAERMWFDFLAAARRVRPAMDVVVIAGNHDSPARLGAASAVLRTLGVHVVGGLPRTPAGDLDRDRLLIPVAGGRGLVCAVPFLRPADLPPGLGEPSSPTDALSQVYGAALAAAREQRTATQALIVTGHLYVAGADTEYLSERRVAVGGVEAAPVRLFPDDITYTALGHIHRAQRVGRDTIRYPGAPLPLALDEAGYKHQVVVLDIDGATVTAIRALAVPRAVEIVRVPDRGAGGVEDVLAALAALPPALEGDLARPYLEVVVALTRPEPRLRALVEAALEGKRPRLVYLHVEHTGTGAALADAQAVLRGATRLAELAPREVFTRLWERKHAEAPTPDILDGFDRLLAEVEGDAADLAAPRGPQAP